MVGGRGQYKTLHKIKPFIPYVNFLGGEKDEHAKALTTLNLFGTRGCGTSVRHCVLQIVGQIHGFKGNKECLFQPN